MSKKLIGQKQDGRKRRKGAATLKPKNFVGKTAQAGHEERLASYIKRTLQLKQIGHPLYRIAQIISEEFNLEVIPHIATVALWRKQAMEAVTDDILVLQQQLRIDQFNELEQMKVKWLAVATADDIQIQRWRMEEGELQPFMDENATKEQIEATKQVVNIMSRQAKLLGLDIEKSPAVTGEGPQDLQSLQIWMINQTNIINPQQGGSIDVQSEVLELRSGIPEIDSV